jgi:hypothetical protein
MSVLEHFALALAISQAGWLITRSYIFNFYRQWAMRQHPLLSYSSSCLICTAQQVALLSAWIIDPIFPPAYGIGYLLEALLLARLSVILYDAGELLSGTLLPHEEVQKTPPPEESDRDQSLSPLD